MARDAQNTNPIRPGYQFRAQTACPIPLGEAGFWFDGTSLLFRTTTGTDLSAGGTSLTFDNGSRPSPASTGATPTSQVIGINSTTQQLEHTDGTTWYDADGNPT